MSGSCPARSAWFFLTTVVTIIYRSTGEPTSLTVCSQPDIFTVQITENERVVHDTELLIRYNSHVKLFSYPDVNSVIILFNEAVIQFTGYMSLEYPAVQSNLLSERVSWNANGIILGISTLQELSSKDYTPREYFCLFLPTNIENSANLSRSVEVKLIHDALFCAAKRLCERIGVTKLKNVNVYNEYELDVLDKSRSFRSSTSDAKIQISVNALANVILKQIIKYIKQNGKSAVKIPNVIETHSIGFGMKYHLKAINGTFEDLSTLKRTDDAIISIIEKTHIIVQVGFGISLARFNYDYYKLDIGLISINGKLRGTIEGLAITIRFVIDYYDTCNIDIDSIKVTEFGNLNLKMTGLGLLNRLTSTVLTWLTKMWRNKIVEGIEINVKDIIKQQVNNLCEDHDENQTRITRYILSIL